MRKEKKTGTEYRVFTLLLYVIFSILMTAVIAGKKNMHTDEVLTYGLANAPEGWITLTNGEVYSPARKAWMDYVTVDENRFDYAVVWRNQAMDVHPPLYYALIHTICSFFPGKFSLWFAGAVNLIFAVLTLWVSRRLLEELTQDSDAVFWGTVFFILSAGILSAVSFLRMYIMAMFEVTLVTWLFVQAVQRGCSWKFYSRLFIAAIAGALTHYYFLVYLFFICVVYGVYLLLHKEFRSAVMVTLSMLLAGAAAVSLFPDMIRHMFLDNGNRGEESIRNLKDMSFSAYAERLRFFYDCVNEQLAGGLLTCLLAAAILSVIYGIVHRRNHGKSQTAMPLLLLLLPGICYFLLVAKMAVLMECRYIVPVYAVVLVGIFSLLYRGVWIWIRQKYRKVTLWLVICAMTAGGWHVCEWEHLYLKSAEFLEKTEQYSEENIIYVYDKKWKLVNGFFEAGNYHNAEFINLEKRELDGIHFKGESSLLVNITNSCDQDSVLDKILEICPLLNTYEMVGGYDYTTTYYLQ